MPPEQTTVYRPTVTSTVPCPITGNPQCGEPFCQHEDGRCYLRDKVGKAESTDHENQRLAVISEFRAKVIALLNSNWPHRTEVDQDTIKRAAALAAQLRNWESWQ